MVEGGRRARFALEALERQLILRGVGGKELQRELAPKAGVLGLVDDTHAARPDLLDDLVVGDETANHALKTEGITGILGSPLPASQ